MKFYLATKNAHKIAEMKRILLPLGIEVVSEGDLDFTMPEVAETGETFSENAYLKAKSAVDILGMPAIADDSGLCVDYLDGAPGIYSSRFAGEEANDKNNIQKLLSLLKGVPDEKRTAYFICSICCLFPDGRKIVSKGKCQGKIAKEMQASSGFGYDPVFMSSAGCFAVIDGKEKDKISHRGLALADFGQKIKEYIRE